MTLTHHHLVAVVAALAVATVVGLALLWPRGEVAPPDAFGEPPEALPATIVGYEPYEGEPAPFEGDTGRRAVITMRVDDGDRAGEEVEVDTGLDGYPPLEVGDRVELTITEGADGEEFISIVDIQRGWSLVLLLGVFVVAVVLVGGWQGVRSLVGLALSLGLVVGFVVPAILLGSSPFLVALVGSMAVLLVSMYLAHGLRLMTSVAVVGTAAALALTVVLGLFFVDLTALTGFASEDALVARIALGELDLRGLVLAGLVIAALGVLDDVTVTQASTVFALRRARPEATAGQLVREAMVVGRDHIASTVNTLVLAYAGASLALLLAFSVGGLPVGEVVTSELVAEEVVKTLVGSLAIVAAVPLTTLLAAVLAVGPSGKDLAAEWASGGHGH